MKITFGHSTATAGILSSIAVLLCLPSMAFAGTILGSAQSFAVLGGSEVTNTGSTTISGSVGVSSGSSMGTPTVVAGTGILYPGSVPPDPVVVTAQADEKAAYLALAALLGGIDESGTDLGSLTNLQPGLYKYTSEAQLTGTLVLDFQGKSNTAFLFQIGTTLTTASTSSVRVLNGDSTDAIFWQVGSSATLGTTTDFAGNILALTAITLGNSATIECGRAFAQTSFVSMDTNTISNNCSLPASLHGDFGSGGFSPTDSSSSLPGTTPEPGTFLLLGISLSLGLAGLTMKHSAHKK